MDIHFSEFTTNLSYRRSWKFKLVSIISLALLLAMFFMTLGAGFAWYITQAPESFPTGELIVIEEGESAREIAATMEAQGVVRSAVALYTILNLFHDPTEIKASTYKFNEPQSAFAVANRLATGEFGIGLIRFVHYEGERNELLANRAALLLEDFNTQEFFALSAGKEGKLFPDTYLIPETYTAAELINLLEATYESRVAPLRDAIANSNYTENEVIIIASLLEREANDRESKRMVAGIIENRLAADMPLQLDASIEYVLDKPLSELTADDLRQDSPYNTYTNPGLPPTPIGNPGLTAIEAVLRPIESNYLFYLTDSAGNFYYARTLSEHNANISQYLR